MIAHSDFRELAARAVDGPLTADERLELGRHRFGCEPCQRYEAGLLADDRALAAMAPLAPPVEVDRRIEAVLADRGAPRRLSPALVVLITALVMAAAVGSALAVGAFLQRQDDGRLPQRPDTPADWTLAISSELDVRVALPPYVTASILSSTIDANEAPLPGSSSWFHVHAVGPRVAEQPAPGLPLEEWILRYAGDASHSGIEVRRVTLPAGRAVEVRTVFMPGTPDATQVLAYAIETADGYAQLQMSGRPEDFANHRADIALIPYLLEAGPMLSAVVASADTLRLQLELPEGWSYHEAVAGRRADVGHFTNRGSDDLLMMGPVDVWIEHYPGGEPRYRLDSDPLPEGMVRVTVAGQPAFRRQEGTRVTWEVTSPGDAPGVWVLTANYSLASSEGMVELIQAILDDSRFVRAR